LTAWLSGSKAAVASLVDALIWAVKPLAGRKSQRQRRPKRNEVGAQIPKNSTDGIILKTLIVKQ
jgi:hypothetical protein